MDENTEKQRVAQAVDAAIEAAGGKQSDLADKVPCAQQTVSKLRSGEIPMTADWALKLSGAVSGAVPPDRFYPPLASVLAHEPAGASVS